MNTEAKFLLTDLDPEEISLCVGSGSATQLNGERAYLLKSEDYDLNEEQKQLIDEIFKAESPKRKEGNDTLTSEDYAYVPDKNKVSTWKLRIDDAAHVAAAEAALGEGYRGNKVEIPSEDLPAVKAKLRRAYKKFYPEGEMPEVFKSLDDEDSNAVLESLNKNEANTGDKNKKNEDIMDIQELLKSAEFTQFLAEHDSKVKEDVQKAAQESIDAAKAEAEAKVAEAKKEAKEQVEEIQKAARAEKLERLEKAFSDQVAGFSFLEEDKKESFVKGLVSNYDNDFVIEMFEIVKAAQEKVDATIEEFATAENGADGKVKDKVAVDKSLEDLINQVSTKYKDKQYLNV